MSFSPVAEMLIVVSAHWLIAWIMTYLIHSSVLIIGSLLLEQLLKSGETRSTLWRVALLGGGCTATAQLMLAEAIGSPPLASAQLPPLVSRLPGTALVLLLLTIAILIGLVTWVVCAEWLALRRLRRKPLPANSTYRTMLAELVSRADLRTVPGMTSSRHIGSPAAIGTREICLPLPFFGLLHRDQQQALIAHELGHIARRDPLWVLIANLLARVLWVQPFNRLAVARLRRAMEDAADEYAIRLTDSISLADALAVLAPLAASGSRPGTAASSAPLFDRVRRILNGNASHRSAHPWVRRFLATAGLTALVTLGPGIGGSSEIASNSIPWLAPSRDEPNSRMLEIRRFNRRTRDFFRAYMN